MEQFADLVWDREADAHAAYMKHLAPVVLFAYNRLEVTRQTITALLKNLYAEDTQLIVYSDGARSKVDDEDVQALRSYLRTVGGFRSVDIVERERNLGLAQNIIQGVTEVVHRFGKVIVLEDDIVTSRYFLKYMNDGLTIYANCPEVMEITGCIYDIDRTNLPEAFFSKKENCWGWATWDRAWKFYERDAEKLLRSFTLEEIYEFTTDGSNDFWDEIKMNADGRLDTWMIFWAAAVYKHGMTLVSREPMTHNIGILGDGGEHFREVKQDVWQSAYVTDHPVRHFPLEFCECFEGRVAERDFWLRLRNRPGNVHERTLFERYHAEPSFENFRAYFLAVEQRERMAQEELQQFCAAHDHVYLYGAGLVAKRLAKAMNHLRIPFDGFVVSTGHRQEDRLMDHPVCEVQEFDTLDTQAGVIVAVGAAHREEVLDLLDKVGKRREDRLIPQLF